MKDLFLIRHAKSSWTDDTLSDIDRPLNKRGRRQVRAMVRPLLELGALDGDIHVSHACRARQTIEGLLEQMPDHGLVARIHFEPELYTFRHKHLLKWLRQLEGNPDSLTIIGHNPALTDLASALAGTETPDMVTAAVTHLKIPVDTWSQLRKGQAEPVRYLPPVLASYSLFQRKAPAPPRKTDDLREYIPATLQYLLARITELQPGVTAGMDPEFLHQFRTALRRSRSITGALHTITGDDSLLKALRPLKRMARQTSTLRDLDVFLMDLEQRSNQDPGLRQSLRASGAGRFFLQWRDSARVLLNEQLDRKAWSRALKRWEKQITGKGLKGPLKKVTPDTIHETVSQRADLCRSLFDQLSPQSPDEPFHEVRKALKRLRYLAELDKPTNRTLLRELKDQQLLYGNFQDRHIQLTLLDTLARARRDQRLPPALAKLAGDLEQEKQQARDAILASPPQLSGA